MTKQQYCKNKTQQTIVHTWYGRTPEVTYDYMLMLNKLTNNNYVQHLSSTYKCSSFARYNSTNTISCVCRHFSDTFYMSNKKSPVAVSYLFVWTLNDSIPKIDNEIQIANINTKSGDAPQKLTTSITNWLHLLSIFFYIKTMYPVNS